MNPSVTIGLLAACVTLLSWTVGTLAFTSASRIVEPLSVNRVRLLYAFILLTIVNSLIFGVSPWSLFISPEASQWLWLGLSGVVGLTIGDYFSFSAYRMIGSSRASLFATIAPVAALLLGMLLLDEHLNITGLIGMAISVAGIMWFVRSQNKSKHLLDHDIPRKDLINGMLFAFLGSVSQGLGLVLAKKGMIHHNAYDMPPVHATWIRMGIAAAVTYAIGLFRSNLWTEFKLVTFHAAHVKPVILGTLFGPVLGVSMSLLAAKNMEVSMAQTIFSLLPVSVMLTAHITGREKVSLSSFIAALISILGVIILVWRDRLFG